jgi:hypothetical protein
MRNVFIITLLLASVSFAHAKDQEDQKVNALYNCRTQNEKQGVDHKDCAAFKKAKECHQQLVPIFEDDLARKRMELADAEAYNPSAPPKPGKHWTHSLAERRSLKEKGVSELAQSVKMQEKANASLHAEWSNLVNEQHEAGCDWVMKLDYATLEIHDFCSIRKLAVLSG